MLTGAEFDLIVQVSVVWLGLFFAAAMWVVNWSAYRSIPALSDDYMAIADVVFGPMQERLP